MNILKISAKMINRGILRLFFLHLLIFTSIGLFAQDSAVTFWDGFFMNSDYSKPFVSEIHSTQCKVELGYNKVESEFDLLEEKSRFQRPMVELHLGFEAPLYATGFGIKGSEKSWGFGIRLPLSVHVLEDMWGPETAPVINTDYRFGAPRFVAIRKISGNRFLKNISFSWIPMFHECTHLGDEITIYRMDEKFPITRINVSYEFTEFQVTLNDPGKSTDNCQSLKLGLMYRLSDRGQGWFSARKNVEITQDINIPTSNYRAEYYADYLFQRSKGFLANKRCVNIFSLEVRNRLRYGYPLFRKVNGAWETKEIKETMEFCFNFYAGYKFLPKNNEGNHSVSLLFHAYNGLNPYGQLRNYSSYPFFGIALTYEP
ncbi:MAG: hypothetical protein WCO28_02925 [Bacteroidota bacterium]|jgi:hypothetical protein